MVKVLKLFVMFLLPAAVAKFEFSIPQSEVSTFLHTNVFLPCYFTVAKSRNGLNFVMVNWRHNDLELAQYKDNEVKTKTSRVVLLESELHRGNASLILKDVAISDEGNYECEVIEAPSMASGKIRLKVRVAPQLSVKHSMLVINQTSVLECRAEDFYPGNISMEWMRDSDPLPAQRPPLIYHHQNGTFSSVIQYNYTPTSEDIKVPVYCRVKYAPQEQKNITLEICYPVFNWSPKTLWKGTIVNATCKLLGCQFSKVTVSWNKGNERLSENFCKEKKECETTVEIQTPSTGQEKEVEFVCKAELEDFETPLVEHINFPTQDQSSHWNVTLLISLAVLSVVILLLVCSFLSKHIKKRKLERNATEMTEFYDRSKPNFSEITITSENSKHFSALLEEEARLLRMEQPSNQNVTPDHCVQNEKEECETT